MKRLLFALSLLAMVLSFTAPAQAESHDECAIWLCAPFGFLPSNCGGALRAMIKRVATLKPAFPKFKYCEKEDSGVDMSFKKGTAAMMVAEQRICVTPGPGSGDDCIEWTVVVPGKYINDTFCYDPGYLTEPEGCIATYNYIEVYQNGEPYGETYYWPK